MFVSALILLFLTSFQSAQTQPSFLESGSRLLRGSDVGYLLDSPTRKKTDLSGIWSYAASDGSEGKVGVPSAYDFTGEVTFTRDFEIEDLDPNQYQYHLVILGANYSCNVTINGDFITHHVGGYTSFIAPIPSTALQVGKENVIRVRTDNRLSGNRTIPLRQQVWGWKNYGGILRDVYILATPKLFIADVAVDYQLTNDLGSATLKLRAAIDGNVASDTAAPRYILYAEVFEKLSGTLVATTASAPLVYREKRWSVDEVKCVIPTPKLWHPDSPDLYFVRTYVVDGTTTARVDEYPLNMGVRKFDLSNGRIKLNNSHVTLKGVIWQEDHARYGGAMPYAQMEKDVILIKNLGANAIRFAQHSPHPYMLNLCDRYGLIVLEELPVRNVPASILTEENYIELAGTMMKEMIVRDRNHPSVLAWGLGDGFEVSSSLSRKYVEPIAALARRLDSRPLFYGTRMHSKDSCADIIDLAALTVSTRDLKEFRQQLEDWRAANPAKAVVLARMGSEVQPNNRNGYSDPLSEEGQARYYTQHYEVVKSAGYDGVFVWSFNDWKGDRPSLTVNSGDPWLHTVGLVTRQREKRLAYDAVRTAFNGERFGALPIGNAPSSSPIVFVLLGLVLLIGTAYLYNANRRFREGLNRSMVNAYNFFADVRDQRIVTIFHSSVLGLIVSAAAASVLMTYLHRFRDNIVLDNFLSYVLVSDKAKETIVHLILQPIVGIAVFTGIFFLALLVVALVVFLIAPIFKARIYPFHAYAVTLWSIPPLLALVPLSMILYRLLDSSYYLIPSILFCLFLMSWVWLRFLKGLSIIFDMSSLKVYSLGIVLLVVAIGGFYYYVDQTHSAAAYLTYLYRDFLGQIP